MKNLTPHGPLGGEQLAHVVFGEALYSRIDVGFCPKSFKYSHSYRNWSIFDWLVGWLRQTEISNRFICSWILIKMHVLQFILVKSFFQILFLVFHIIIFWNQKWVNLAFTKFSLNFLKQSNNELHVVIL